jgi:hypothetical protein
MARWAAMSSLPRFVLQPKMMSKNTKLAGGRLEMECKLRDPEMQRNLEGENGERERERERERRDFITFTSVQMSCHFSPFLVAAVFFASKSRNITRLSFCQ